MTKLEELQRNMTKDLEHYLVSCGYADAKDRAKRDVNALVTIAKEEGKAEFQALFRYAVEGKMADVVPATPEEIAHMKHEIELHKDEELNFGKKPVTS